MSWSLSDIPNSSFCSALDRYLTELPEYDEEPDDYEPDEYDDFWREEDDK